MTSSIDRPEPSLRAHALAAYARGDDDAAGLVAAALAADRLDGGVLIADATLALEQRSPAALDRLAAMLARAPDWIDGHVALARLRWGTGDRNGFAASIEQALRVLPRHTGLWMRYMEVIAESGQPLRAADVAADLRRSGGDAPALRLIEARHAGAAGALDRAGQLLGSLDAAMPGHAAASARYRLQRGDAQAAMPMLDRARAADPADIGLWALTELAWRATDDPRHRWLIDPDTMIAAVDVVADAATRSSVIEALRRLHRVRWPALGQSARGGTQTRGNLALNAEPSIALLFDRLRPLLAEQARNVRAADPHHPLATVAGDITGAWSIRIEGHGHHVAHVHPGGALSSALHLSVPPGTTGKEGWLELGRPPADIALRLEPLVSFAPVPGRMILFPSFLYHGTIPFGTGERLTVAFDVA